MPNLEALLRRSMNDGSSDSPNGDEYRDAWEFIWLFMNGGLSVALVLLGGLFAGLTIGLMGQDQTFLKVIAISGEGEEKRNAQKVLNLLQRGKHWVLVTLLLGNVITNETLPIVLDKDVSGGAAVLMSTISIVIFGEIIPQSVCAKYGLKIGARSATFIKWLMYALSPVAYPTACLLDRLLGRDHGIMFNRAGLKSLIMLHENLSGLFPQRLNQEEVTVISSIIDMKNINIGTVMTPMTNVYSLNTETVLNDMTCYNILKSGYSCIPINMASDPSKFTGVLSVKSLVAMRFEDVPTIGQISLSSMPTVRPEVSCQDVIHLFRHRRSEMVLVTEGGTSYGQPIGILTYKDVMEEVIGDPGSLK